MGRCGECSQWFDSMQKVDDDGVVMDAPDGWCLMSGREVGAGGTPCVWFEARDAGEPTRPARRGRPPLELPVACAVSVASYVAAALCVRRAMATSDPLDVVYVVGMACVGTFWLLVALRSGRDAR